MNKTNPPAQGAWAFLNDTERDILTAFAGEVQKIIDAEIPEDLFAEEQFFPNTPVGRNAQDQGTNRARLWGAYRVTNESTSASVEIVHPQDFSFTKWEVRNGIKAVVRRKFVHPDSWKRALHCVWSPVLREMGWTIYICEHSEPSHACAYLNTSVPAVNTDGDDKAHLYVPYLALAQRDWPAIAAYHEKHACGYYRNGNFDAAQDQAKTWEEQTRSCLVSPEAMALKAWCEKP
jgi:hypothetical protein